MARILAVPVGGSVVAYLGRADDGVVRFPIVATVAVLVVIPLVVAATAPVLWGRGGDGTASLLAATAAARPRANDG